jgi:hypothetical protein
MYEYMSMGSAKKLELLKATLGRSNSQEEEEEEEGEMVDDERAEVEESKQ